MSTLLKMTSPTGILFMAAESIDKSMAEEVTSTKIFQKFPCDLRDYFLKWTLGTLVPAVVLGVICALALYNDQKSDIFSEVSYDDLIGYLILFPMIFMILPCLFLLIQPRRLFRPNHPNFKIWDRDYGWIMVSPVKDNYLSTLPHWPGMDVANQLHLQYMKLQHADSVEEKIKT